MSQATVNRVTASVVGFLFVAAVAFSWLVFPYLVNGDRMLFETGQQVQNERFDDFRTLNQMLTRFNWFPGGIEVTALYASDEYFQYADRKGSVEAFRPDRHIVFFLAEDVHTELLPEGLADATLTVGDRTIDPVSAEGPELVEHHRTTILRFAKFDEQGQPYIDATAGELKLTLTHAWDRDLVDNGELLPVDSEFVWELPLDIPVELMSRDTFTSIMVFSLSAGLLASVLTPCLIQLVLIFFATLGGITAEQVVAEHGISPEVRRKVLWLASCFVAGYIALFVVSGALIGYAGKEAQLFFANYTRAVGIGAGVIVILFGVWLGIRAKAPIVCRLPGAETVQQFKSKGTIGTVLVSIAFSLGCMSCFGGAIIGTLLIYVGALGSASVGASLMGIFAAGVAIPFLLAAYFFSRMQGLFEAIARHTRLVGAVSSAFIVFFGLLLVSDNFHTVSDAIYPFLGLE
ncbi:MAG: cytochrome c biogenesis protein CcdA [Gammaproteobacteria bacterium]|nr:cytochrome c biogenesis protein CcdA [Gammaproteobacteria bacterium]MDH3435131.1 cytochrome c biogenesis protein CcdA [Gammaproteobacteria bacterium]